MALLENSTKSLKHNEHKFYVIAFSKRKRRRNLPTHFIKPVLLWHQNWTNIVNNNNKRPQTNIPYGNIENNSQQNINKYNSVTYRKLYRQPSGVHSRNVSLVHCLEISRCYPPKTNKFFNWYRKHPTKSLSYVKDHLWNCTADIILDGERQYAFTLDWAKGKDVHSYHSYSKIVMEVLVSAIRK